MQGLNQLLESNVNVKKPEVNTNVNVNNVRAKATRLSQKLNDQNSFKFFCKVAWKLPESFIEETLEQALTKGRPAAYFTAVCKVYL